MKFKVSLIKAAIFSATSFVAIPVQAEMYWADNSLSVLHGSVYKNAFSDKKEEITTLTLEHASSHNWGDAFFFMDRHNGKGSAGGFNETYAELSPRLSLSSVTHSKLEFGPISDVLIATTYEFGSDSSGFSQDNYLLGVGLNWNIPGFAFFQTNFFHVNNEQSENDIQLTVVYGAPFSIAEIDFMVDGFFDWSSAEDDHASDFHFNPQIRADIGKFVGVTKSKIEAGIEYSYWNNKFGVKSDHSESVVSAIIKIHL